MSGSKAVERVGVAGLEFQGAGEKADGLGEVALAGVDIGKDDMVPSVTGCQA